MEMSARSCPLPSSSSLFPGQITKGLTWQRIAMEMRIYPLRVARTHLSSPTCIEEGANQASMRNR